MNVGGPAVQVSTLEKAINGSIFEHQLITGLCDSSEIDFLTSTSVSLNEIRIPSLGKRISLWHDLIAFFRLREEIKKFNPDIVHTHTAKAGILGRLASWSVDKKQKRVHTFHGHLLIGYFSPLFLNFYCLVEKLLSMITDHSIAVGKKVREDLLNAGIGRRESFSVIYPGIDTPERISRSKASDFLNINSESKYIVWIGRLVEIKKPERLLVLARKLKESKNNWRILIAGDGPLRDDLEFQCKLEELPIDFLGWQTNISAVFSIADLVMLSSDNEGTPISLIQSQLMGIPVISTDVGSVREVMVDGKSGLLIDKEIENSLQDIYKLMNDAEKRGSMGQLAREFARNKFGIDRFLNEHEKLYASLFSNQANS
jgi:glycosyltransferase involved in cell wall biosynthesis